MSCFCQKSSSQRHQPNWERGFSDQYKSENTLGQYAFGYNEDHTSGGSFRRETSDEFGNKIGSYGLRVSDGRVRIVNYVADNNGYRADVYSNEPGLAPQNFGNSLRITKKSMHGVIVPGFSYSGEAPHVSLNNLNQDRAKVHPERIMQFGASVSTSRVEDQNPMALSEDLNQFDDGHFSSSRNIMGGFGNRLSNSHRVELNHQDNTFSAPMESYTGTGHESQDDVVYSPTFDDHSSYDDNKFRSIPDQENIHKYIDDNVQDVTPEYPQYPDVTLPIEKPNSFAQEEHQLEEDLSYYPSNLHASESSNLHENTTLDSTQTESTVLKHLQTKSFESAATTSNLQGLHKLVAASHGLLSSAESAEKKVPEVIHTNQENNATITK